MLFLIILMSFTANSYSIPNDNLSSSKQYKDWECIPITTGDLWVSVCNNGSIGDPNADQIGCPAYQWPGGRGPSYLWEGRLWVGTMVEGTPYVSHADYGNYEWTPGEWGFRGRGKSDFDAVCSYNDWGNENWGRAIGIKIIQRALSWNVGPARNIIAYEFDVIFDHSKSDVVESDVLEEFYFSVCFDADVCEADPLDPPIDDIVLYDGWTGGEWASLTHFPSPSDDYTILPDTTLLIPDGIPDQVCLFGDDTNEATILGDTQWVWRDMSFLLDGNNLDEPGNDSTEYGLCPGVIFASMLYAPESPRDSIWKDSNGELCRIPRPASHQWWNWNNDPGTDRNKYDYMTGEHPMSFGYKFLPHPYDVGAGVFDYRFLLTYGPYSIADGDTIHFVLATGVGQGLNGGVDEGYGRGYLPGARQLRDYTLTMYYSGATHSDPYHPSAPDEDEHWVMPSPPEIPELHYSISEGVINLVWSDIAEVTPDRRTGLIDFAGYRVYRSEWRPGTWVLLDSFTVAEGNVQRNYTDGDVTLGIPYYYAVTSFDTEGLESGKTNYMKDYKGAEVPLYVASPLGNALDSVLVVPNPYYGSASWEAQYEDKIKFMYLPQNSRIKVFTLSGDLVWETEHIGTSGDVDWDLVCESGIKASSGLYVYKIEQSNASGTDVVDTRIGKLLIMR